MSFNLIQNRISSNLFRSYPRLLVKSLPIMSQFHTADRLKGLYLSS